MTAPVRLAVHSHYGDELIHSMAVGVTHWEEFGAGGARAARAVTDLVLRPRPGRQTLQGLGPRRPRDSGWPTPGTHSASGRGGWLEVIHGRGFEAVQSAYLDVLEGRVDAKRAHVLSLR